MTNSFYGDKTWELHVLSKLNETCLQKRICNKRNREHLDCEEWTLHVPSVCAHIKVWISARELQRCPQRQRSLLLNSCQLLEVGLPECEEVPLLYLWVGLHLSHLLCCCEFVMGMPVLWVHIQICKFATTKCIYSMQKHSQFEKYCKYWEDFKETLSQERLN